MYLELLRHNERPVRTVVLLVCHDMVPCPTHALSGHVPLTHARLSFRSYKAVAKNSYVDESLFGNSKAKPVVHSTVRSCCDNAA